MNWSQIFPTGRPVRVSDWSGGTAIVTGYDTRADNRTVLLTTAGRLLVDDCGSTVVYGCDGINRSGGYVNAAHRHVPFAETRCGLEGEDADLRQVGHLFLCATHRAHRP